MDVYTNKQIENSGNLSAVDNPVCWQQHSLLRRHVNSTRLIRRQLSHWTHHVAWRDGENSHKRNIQFRKQTTNRPKLWYGQSKRTNKQITDILCSVIRKKSAASLRLSYLSPTKCYLKIGGKAKEREMDKWKAEMSSAKNKFNSFTQYKSHVRFQTQFRQ